MVGISAGNGPEVDDLRGREVEAGQDAGKRLEQTVDLEAWLALEGRMQMGVFRTKASAQWQSEKRSSAENLWFRLGGAALVLLEEPLGGCRVAFHSLDLSQVVGIKKAGVCQVRET